MAAMGIDDVFAIVIRNSWSVSWDAAARVGNVHCRKSGLEGAALINQLPGDDRKEFRYWLNYRGMMLASYWDPSQKQDLAVAWDFVKRFLTEHIEAAALDLQGEFPAASCDILVALAVNRALGRLAVRTEGGRYLYKLVPLSHEVAESQRQEREMVAA